MKKGFTSYANAHITCPCLPDHLFRLKFVLESHMGVKRTCVVMIKTLAYETNKHPKTVSKQLKKLLKISNLEMKLNGKIYRFSIKGNTSITYGRTPVSHIMPHECSLRKKISKKELIKNLSGDRDASKNESNLSDEEEYYIEEISRWCSQALYNTKTSPISVKKMISNSADKYGINTIKTFYFDTIHSTNHPKEFWNKIKDLKERKNGR